MKLNFTQGTRFSFAQKNYNFGKLNTTNIRKYFWKGIIGIF